MKKFTNKATNAVEPAAPSSVWGYKGCAGKGGKTTNFVSKDSDNKNAEKENV